MAFIADPKPLIIYGRQPLLEALRANYALQRITLSKDASGKIIHQIKKLAESQKIPLHFVKARDELQKVCGPVVHQGVAAIGAVPVFRDESELEPFIKSKPNPFLVILDQIQDPHNMGAIMRSCEIAGVDALVLPEKGSAELNGTVAKTSAGALFHVTIFKVRYLEQTIELFNASNIDTFALMPSAEGFMYDKNLTDGVALVVGSEGSGVRKNIANLCKAPISIPQFGKINSLNASVATAVVLYEVVRQRSKKSRG